MTLLGDVMSGRKASPWRDAKIDHVEDLKERIVKVRTRLRTYLFVNLLHDLSVGAVTMQLLPELVGFVARDEGMKSEEVCSQLLEQIAHDPMYGTYVTADMSVWLRLASTEHVDAS